jgi:membrane-associated protease RseP (regulator of RpoE activity)
MTNRSTYLLAVGTFAISLFIYGCATILKGALDQVDVSSDPNNAKVYINGQYYGKTPLHLRLAAKKTYFVEFVMEGYEKKTYVLSSSVGAGWIVLDVLFGIIPVVVDAATGSWYRFDDHYARVYLEKQSGAKIDQSVDSQKPNETESSDNSGKVGLRLGLSGIIVELVQNMPASTAGIHVGDRLLQIDGMVIPSDNFDAVLSMLHGTPGTKVELTVQRDNQNLVFKLTRQKY